MAYIRTEHVHVLFADENERISSDGDTQKMTGSAHTGFGNSMSSISISVGVFVPLAFSTLEAIRIVAPSHRMGTLMKTYKYFLHHILPGILSCVR